jgi:hypothetical protein
VFQPFWSLKFLRSATAANQFQIAVAHPLFLNIRLRKNIEVSSCQNVAWPTKNIYVVRQLSTAIGW